MFALFAWFSISYSFSHARLHKAEYKQNIVNLEFHFHLAPHVWVGGVWEVSAPKATTSYSFSTFRPFFLPPEPKLPPFFFQKTIPISLFFWLKTCLSHVALQLVGFLVVSRAEWLWNRISFLLQNTGNQAKACAGLWWQRSKFQAKTRECGVLQTENWSFCSVYSGPCLYFLLKCFATDIKGNITPSQDDVGASDDVKLCFHLGYLWGSMYIG